MGSDAASPAQPLDAGASLDANFELTPPILPSAAPDACVGGQLPLPEPRCALPDLTEPNSKSTPATLTVDPTCGVVQGQLTEGDDDAYRFTTSKADPVSIELHYATAGEADLGLRLLDGQGKQLSSLVDPRRGESELVSRIFMAGADASYVVEVDGEQTGSCQPYSFRVNPSYCTDSHEDNETLETATELSWADDQTAEVTATSHELDRDFYAYSTPKADPVLVTGSYTAEGGASIALRRTASNIAGDGFLDELGDRRGTLSESFAHWLPSETAGAKFAFSIWARGSGCAPYTLKFDAAACTDAFEDNDEVTAARPLPLGEDVAATAFRNDHDFYDIGALVAGGRCTITYTTEPGQRQQLRAFVKGPGSNSLGSEVGGRGEATKVITLSWADRPATTLEVNADYGGCQPYVVRCEAPASTPPAQ